MSFQLRGHLNEVKDLTLDVGLLRLNRVPYDRGRGSLASLGMTQVDADGNLSAQCSSIESKFLSELERADAAV
jgi:hypothetical protein